MLLYDEYLAKDDSARRMNKDKTIQSKRKLRLKLDASSIIDLYVVRYFVCSKNVKNLNSFKYNKSLLMRQLEFAIFDEHHMSLS